MVKTFGSLDKVRRKFRSSFARQYLDDYGVSIFRGDDQILEPVGRLYNIKLPNTRYFVGDTFIDRGETKKIRSYEELKDMGFCIISQKIGERERWATGQQVIYLLKKISEVNEHLGAMPGGKYGVVVEYDMYNKQIRLLGPRAGPLGYGPWVNLSKKGNPENLPEPPEMTYKGYGRNADKIIDSQMREWLGIEEDPAPIFIKEAAFMITHSNEIVCIPDTNDMPSILISGMKGCLTKDTLIDMPRDLEKYPKGIPMEELLDRKDFYVYSFNIEKKKLEVKKAQSCEFSKIEDVYELELVNGQKIKATEDHPFLLMNGQYKKLKDLIWSKGKSKYVYWDKETKTYKLTDRLRMFSRPTTLKRDNIIKVDFNPIQENETSYMHSMVEHRFVAEQIYGNIDGKSVHHLNHNPFDHSPENLDIMDQAMHFREHGMQQFAFQTGNIFCKNTGYSTKKKSKISISDQNKTNKELYFKSEKYRESREKYKKNLSKLHKEKHGWSGGVIKEIRHIGKQPVYDIVGVEDNKNYIANGFLVSNTGKSFCMHSIIDRLFWKPAYNYKIVIMNDSSRETGTWCQPNSDDKQILLLKRLNERPLPLPTVYLHPLVKEDYEKLFMGNVGFDVTIPFKEVVQNHRTYMKMEGSARYFTKISEDLLNCKNQEEAEQILDSLSLAYNVPQNTANKIRAEFETLFDSKMTDISSKKQELWSTSKNPDITYNPVTACVHAGILPVLETEFVSNDRRMLSIYFTYFVNDLFKRQKQDPDFLAESSELLIVLDEAHNISQKGVTTGADFLLRRCVREGRPRRIGTLLATQKFMELPDVIKDNSTYLICFKNPGEAAAIANQYKMGKGISGTIKDLDKHECVAYTTEHFIVYDSNGKRRKSKTNEIFRGKSLPPYSLHKKPKKSNN